MDELDLEAYGKRLYDDLFEGPVDDAYNQALTYAHLETAGRLRLQLEIDRDAPELQVIRWETLHAEDRLHLEPLATNIQTPFSRYTALNIPEAAPGEYPVKILYAIANPSDIDDWNLARVDVETEIRNMMAACADLQRTGLIRLSIMPGQSGNRLSRKLFRSIHASLGSEGLISGPTSLANLKSVLDQFHIFHFLGHGRFRKARVGRDALPDSDEANSPAAGNVEEFFQAALFLENDDPEQAGTVDLVDDETFAEALDTIDGSLKLVFLASCETARIDAPGGPGPAPGGQWHSGYHRHARRDRNGSSP